MPTSAPTAIAVSRYGRALERIPAVGEQRRTVEVGTGEVRARTGPLAQCDRVVRVPVGVVGTPEHLGRHREPGVVPLTDRPARPVEDPGEREQRVVDELDGLHRRTEAIRHPPEPAEVHGIDRVPPQHRAAVGGEPVPVRPRLFHASGLVERAGEREAPGGQARLRGHEVLDRRDQLVEAALALADRVEQRADGRALVLRFDPRVGREGHPFDRQALTVRQATGEHRLLGLLPEGPDPRVAAAALVGEAHVRGQLGVGLRAVTLHRRDREPEEMGVAQHGGVAGALGQHGGFRVHPPELVVPRQGAVHHRPAAGQDVAEGDGVLGGARHVHRLPAQRHPPRVVDTVLELDRQGREELGALG